MWWYLPVVLICISWSLMTVRLSWCSLAIFSHLILVWVLFLLEWNRWGTEINGEFVLTARSLEKYVSTKSWRNFSLSALCTLSSVIFFSRPICSYSLLFDLWLFLDASKKPCMTSIHPSSASVYQLLIHPPTQCPFRWEVVLGFLLPFFFCVHSPCPCWFL